MLTTYALSLIAAATDLPVSADLEGGYGDAPATVAETIRLAAQAGAVGGSIEDATGDEDRPSYDIGPAAERVAAAAEAAASLPYPFVLTGRAEKHLHGRAEVGVRRVSVGSALHRAALAAFLRAAQEMSDAGSFTFAADAIPSDAVTPAWDSAQ